MQLRGKQGLPPLVQALDDIHPVARMADLEGRPPHVNLSKMQRIRKLRLGSRDGATPPSDICHPSTTNGASYPPLAQIHDRPRIRVNSNVM